MNKGEANHTVVACIYYGALLAEVLTAVVFLPHFVEVIVPVFVIHDDDLHLSLSLSLCGYHFVFISVEEIVFGYRKIIQAL